MVKYYIKNAAFLLVCMLMCSVLSLIITLIETTWVKFTLSLISLTFFFFQIFAFSDNMGREGQRRKNANLAALKATLATGREVNVEKEGEFRWYNPIIISSITCSLLVLFLLIQLIITSAGSDSVVFTNIIKIMFAVFYAPQNAFSTTISIYYTALYIPATVGVAVIGYYVGKAKTDAEQRKISQINEKIYGTGDDE